MNKKFKNRQTPIWKIAGALAMILHGLVILICLGLYEPYIYDIFLDWKLRRMFDLEEK